MDYGCHSMVKRMGRVLIKHPKDAFISQENLEKNWEAFNYIACPNYKDALNEYEEFERIIRENVDVVEYLPRDDNAGLDSIYAHDSLKVTKKGAIYFPMGKELRSREAIATEKHLQSLGIPTLGHIKSPGKMEGGDLVWLDDETIAIGLGYRTNEEGIRQFKELTKDFIKNYVIVQLPHAGGEDECLHLMSLISLVDEDLAVVYSEYMPVVFRNLLMERGIELLEVDKKEYNMLGSNVLALGPRKCLIIEGVPEITKKLRGAGCEVFTYKGNEISYLGTGGPTCLTHPLLRI